MDIVIIANFCRDFSETDNGRFMYLCKELCKEHNVEIITSSFNHAKKIQKDKIINDHPFKITFLHEPGYKKNISLRRFSSHYSWGKEVKKYLKNRKKPDVVYCAVPSLTAPVNAAKYCKKNKIRFIIDIQDLWPEAFQMVFNVPVLSQLIFKPFKMCADKIYATADEIIGVSQTYVERALKVNNKVENGCVVFLGTKLETFDENAKKNPVNKDDELWLGYCGSMSGSYDIKCVIDALSYINNPPKFIAMGDGFKRKEFEDYAHAKGVNCYFTGKLPYDQMCGWLKACDIVVNPIKGLSAASIVNKHSDYASSGLPVLNTQESTEYRNLVDGYNMGYNCNNNDPKDLADKMRLLIENRELRDEMGKNSRKCAEELFDRKKTYGRIINVICNNN